MLAGPELGGAVELLRRWYRRQARRFPGLIEGTAPATLLLATVMSEKVAPRIAAFAPYFYVWVDDGIVLAPDEATATAVRATVDEAVREVGLRLHCCGKKATRVGSIDGSVFKFLGHAWSSGNPSPTTGSALDLLRGLR